MIIFVIILFKKLIKLFLLIFGFVIINEFINDKIFCVSILFGRLFSCFGVIVVDEKSVVLIFCLNVLILKIDRFVLLIIILVKIILLI